MVEILHKQIISYDATKLENVVNADPVEMCSPLNLMIENGVGKCTGRHNRWSGNLKLVCDTLLIYL